MGPYRKSKSKFAILAVLVASMPLARAGDLARTPDGQPDLQGFWTNSTITPLERPAALAGKAWFTEDEAAAYEKRVLAELSTDRRDGSPEVDVNRSYNELFRERGGVVTTRQTSLIVDPPDGRIPPLTPEGKRRAALRAAERRARGPAHPWEDQNLAVRCITRGAPKIAGGYNNNFQIVQTQGYIAILQEMIHEVRVIPLDEGPHIDPSVKLWMGDSRGHWEGDTLVVDTTNYRPEIIFNSFNCCGEAGENLHVTERFHRVNEGMIDYRYTVDDPVVYTRPWTVSIPLNKIDGPIFEYACHEGNYAMTDMLRGAREQEKKGGLK